MLDFTGRVAVITGAGKGLGRAYALALARRGVQVVVNNHRREDDAISSADEVVHEIRRRGGAAHANYEPVGRVGSGDRIVADVLEQFGRLDIVIANAGVSSPAAFHHQSWVQIEESLAVNLLGTLQIVRAALDPMREQRFGRILATTSSAVFGDAGFVAYGIAKAAVVGLVTCLAQESRRADVRINGILPFAATPMTSGLMQSGTFPPETPEIMTPEGVATVATWLVSPQCETTGEIWVVGGSSVRRLSLVLNEGVTLDRNFTAEDVAASRSGIAALAVSRSFPDGATMLGDLVARNIRTLNASGKRRAGSMREDQGSIADP